jgi:hypothetical protein
MDNFNITPKLPGGQFIHHLDTPNLRLTKDEIEALGPIDFYETKILQSIEKHYDDLEDFINIQQALMRVQARVMENIKQCLQQ